MRNKTTNYLTGSESSHGRTDHHSDFPIHPHQLGSETHLAELIIFICIIIFVVGFGVYLIEHLVLFLQNTIGEKIQMPPAGIP